MPPSPRRGRLLSGSDSWRRIALTGIVGGVTIAFVAALIASLVGGGNDALDSETAPPQPPASGPADGAPVDPLPVDEPLAATEQAPAPTESPRATQMPAATATGFPTRPAPTETPPEQTATPLLEEPTATSTVEE